MCYSTDGFLSREFWSARDFDPARVLHSSFLNICELFGVKMDMSSHLTASISPKSVVLLQFDMKDGYSCSDFP